MSCSESWTGRSSCRVAALLFALAAVVAIAAPARAQNAVDPSPLFSPAERRALSGTDGHAPRQTARTDVGRQGGTARKWEIEGHVGGAFFTNPTSGNGQMPTGGAVYIFEPALPPSREVASWYFGDGTLLFNNTYRIWRAEPIAALDPVLIHSGTRQERGYSFGFRVARAITDRFVAEFSLDGSPASVRMTDEMRAGIEASSASFERAFASAVAINAAASSATIRQEGGARLTASGAVNINLLTGHRVTPYATIGGGVVLTHGTLPGATLVGNYTRIDDLEETGITLVDDTDTVTIRYEETAAPIVLFGGGVRFELTPRSGIRGDVRISVGPINGAILIDSAASHAGAPYYSLTVSGAGSSVVYSSPGHARQRSLSAPPLSGFETFTATGHRTETAIAAGYFVRF